MVEEPKNNGQSHPERTQTFDVLVVGGGPTGLVLSYCLLGAGLDVLVIEQHETDQQAMHGRACMLYGRSLELLDQMGLHDLIADTGYIIRGAVTYKGWEELHTRGWTFVQKALDGNTHFNYCLSIRQKLLEEAYRGAISRLDPRAFRAPAKLLDYTIDTSHKHPVLSKVVINGVVTDIRSKYLVGADGGRSTVRALAKIPFPGTASPFRWIRLDAIVRTDMPSGRRGGVAVESASHGNILWTPTDNGRTRIGFVCPNELYGKNGECIDAKAVIAEAQKALKPYSVEFIKLDWWTVYAIGQRVAERLKEGSILLAGDAAHTHSSGAAQGMNTGLHDASNLAWKLAGVLKGWYTEAVLDTYSTERHKAAQQIIQIDKDVSSLISGVIPAHFNAAPDANPNDYLEEVFATSATFTVGLGIHYDENLINVKSEGAPNFLRVRTGFRAPDPPLFRPGSKFPKRLQELTPNKGKFWILVFAGGLDPASEQPQLRQSNTEQLSAFRSYIMERSSFVNVLAPVFEFLTLVRGDRILQVAETLGGQPLGKAVYDQSGEAYKMYGVDETSGAIVVLRPDGIVGFATAVGHYQEVGHYFTRFVRPAVGREWSEVAEKPRTAKPSFGEISLEGEAEEIHHYSLPA